MSKAEYQQIEAKANKAGMSISAYVRTASLRHKITVMQKRQDELGRLFKRLYEDRMLERIPEEQCQMLAQDYTRE